jgi:hypothetical protein
MAIHLFMGIHNAWDTATSIAVEYFPPKDKSKAKASK